MNTFSLPPSPAYLVALSGGADSVLLLALTVRALSEREPAGSLPVAAAHLHHGIRGAEADRDEAFCRALCERLGVRLIVGHADVPALAAEGGESIETVARRVRYDFFLKIMTEESIPTLLTGHHADDHLETLLDRLLRGSGTHGMGGIPPTRSLGTTPDGMSLTVARPLLDYTRREILEACARLGLDFVTDSTNNDTAYTRNRLRHTVVPALETLAGAGVPQRAAARLSRAAREDDACLSSLAEEQVAAHTAPDGGLKLAALQSSHPAIAKRMIGILYDRATAGICPYGQGTLAAVHLDGLWELIQKGIPESSLNLPLSMTARIRGERLYIWPAAPTPPPTEPIPVSLGDTPWGDRVLVRIEASESILPPLAGQDVWASAVFPPALPLPLTARPRAQGDTIYSHGMNKKLKKLLCDKNIPPHLRDTLPLLCLPDGTPLWYPAAAFRDGFPAPREGACLRITVFLQNQI